MQTFEEWLNHLDGDALCAVCSYSVMGCTGGVRGGPNGPIYPPCADSDADEIVDMDAARETYDEEACEGCTSRLCDGCEHQH